MSAADKTKLDGIAEGAQVNSITGVKGNAENSYRTGNVNLTPGNIGAVKSDGDTMIGTLTVPEMRVNAAENTYPTYNMRINNVSKGSIRYDHTNERIQLIEWKASGADAYSLPTTNGEPTGNRYFEILTNKSPVTAPALARTDGGTTNATLVLAPGGGYVNIKESVTGAMKITLPVSWTSTFLSFDVDIYDYYSNQTITYHIAGYTTTNWGHCSAYATGRGVKANLTVRFGHDGTHCCVLIGETNTTWGYPNASIRDVRVGYNGTTIANWATGWNISFVTELPTITEKVTQENPNVLEVSNGGTGATTAAEARTNLGITPANIGAKAIQSNVTSPAPAASEASSSARS